MFSATASLVFSTSSVKMTGTGPLRPVSLENQGMVTGHLASITTGMLSDRSSCLDSMVLAGAGSDCS